MKSHLPFLTVCFFLFFLATSPAAPPRNDATDLRLRVSQALPVVGKPQTVTARILNPSADFTDAEVLFQITQNGRTVPLSSSQTVALAKGKSEATAASIDWTPTETGECLLEAILKTTKNGPPQVASQRITVVKRPLHFHYWHMDPSLKYVTEGLVQKEAPMEYWTDRGAVAQRWVGGIWAVKTVKRDTVEKLARSWTSKQWPGIVIDEFGSPGEVDRLLAEALIETRKRMPQLYLAPYAISPSEDTFEAFRTVADRVLVECYCPNGAYHYARIRNRTDIARQNGFLNKTLTVLGIGNALGKNSPTITTPQELQRQLHYLRWEFPKMSGVAFFSGFSPLYPALNDLLRRFYILPVLRVEPLSDGGLKVQNIGADDAPETRISLQKGKEIQHIDVPALSVGASTKLTAPAEALPTTEFRDDCTILGPPLVWEEEPASYRPGADTPWHQEKSRFLLRESFETDPSSRISSKKTAEPKPEASTTTPTAVWPLAKTTTKAFSLSFDLEMVHAGHYGSFQISLEKEGKPDRLRIQFYRGDYEPGIYAALTVTNAEGIVMAERLALRLTNANQYRFRCQYDEAGSIRLGIWNDSGEKLWDTGQLPTYGTIGADRLRVTACAGQDSLIKWDSKDRKLHIRGKRAKTYYSEAKLDNLTITIADQT